MSSPRERPSGAFSSATRVIMMPAATEISSEGICDTIASPTDRIENRFAASLALMPW